MTTLTDPPLASTSGAGTSTLISGDSAAGAAAGAKKKVLICGASIAGPALAYGLQKEGHSVVVVERAEVFRTGGQNVDIEGPGQEVIQRMGLEEAILAKNTREKGVRFLDGQGRAIASLAKGAVGSLTTSYEILRGDLAGIIYEATKERCEYRFGTTVTALAQSDAAVSVTFSSGATETFDLVVCAEGVGSSTRRLVMEESFRYRYLGVYASYFRVPRRPEDDDWACIYHGKGGSFVLLRPVHDHDTTVVVTFPRKQFDAREAEVSAQKSLLRAALAEAGGLAERVLADLDYDRDFYVGPLSQIIASRWSQGRFVLLGDAAYCPSAYTGQGTPLALVGAYILAGELKKHRDHAEAFRSYEALMRPYVASGRALNPAVIRLFHPKSALGIWILRTLARLLASRPAQALFRRFGAGEQSTSASGFALPNYS